AHAAPAAGRNDVRRAAALHHHPQQRFPADGRARGHSAPHAGHRRHPREAGTLPRAVGNSTARPARMDKGGTCMKILIDARRGENAPLCVLQGAAQAASEFGDGMTLAVLGDEQALRDCAAANKIDLSPFEIIPCTEVIDMHDDLGAGDDLKRGKIDRKSTRLNSSHVSISYAVFCLKKKNNTDTKRIKTININTISKEKNTIQRQNPNSHNGYNQTEHHENNSKQTAHKRQRTPCNES